MIATDAGRMGDAVRIVFDVLGPPCAKGRPKFASRGKFVQAYTPQTTVNYENMVKLEFERQCGGSFFEGAVEIEILACFPIPKSESKKRQAMMESGEMFHTKKPDADNLAKSVIDAINGVAFRDDSQVAILKVVKKYARQPFVRVAIEDMEICSQSENGRNLKLKKSNTSGHTGVTRKPNGRYSARISVKGKNVTIGTFDTEEEAVQARRNAEIEHFGEFAPSESRKKENVK